VLASRTSPWTALSRSLKFRDCGASPWDCRVDGSGAPGQEVDEDARGGAVWFLLVRKLQASEASIKVPSAIMRE